MSLLDNTAKVSDLSSNDFDAIVVVGGQGPMFTFRDETGLQNAFLEFYNKGKVSAALCHGTSLLLYLKDKDGKPLIEGKKITGFTDEEEDFADIGVRIPASYQWIEKKPLHIPIADYRKHTIDLVLAPFLIVIKRLYFGESYSIIKDWIVKCNKIEMLKPSIEYFDSKIKAAINNSIQCRIPPILIENIEKRYPNWYKHIKNQKLLLSYC